MRIINSKFLFFQRFGRDLACVGGVTHFIKLLRLSRDIFQILAILTLLSLQALPALSQELPVKMRAQRLIYNDKKHLIKLYGAVSFEYQEEKVKAAYAEFHTDTREAFFKKEVTADNPEFALSCDQLKVWYQEKKALATGRVAVITHKPKTSKSEHFTPAYLNCNELELLWNKGVVYARENVKVQQGNRTAYADEGIYYITVKTLDLSGKVRMEQDGEWLNCSKARMDLTQETFTALGGVEGNFKIKEKNGLPQETSNPQMLYPPEIND